MLGKKLGLDLGTATTRVVTRGEGLLFAEPTVVTMRDGDPSTGLAGLDALEAVGGDSGVRLHRPLRGGNVADRAALEVLIQQVVNRAVGRQRIFKPDMVVAVRSGMSGADRRAVLEAVTGAGARTVYLIDAAIAAAMGAGVPIASSRAHLVIDIGAGKTDVAVLALEGTVAVRSLAVGVDDLLASLGAHVHRQHGAQLTRAEVVGVAHLLVAASHEERTAEVGGTLLSSYELAPLVAAHLQPLDAALLEVLAETPAQLRGDIRAGGLLLTGGGARQEGLDRHLAGVCGHAARLVGEPEGCTVRGTALAVDNLDVLKRSFLYMR